MALGAILLLSAALAGAAAESATCDQVLNDPSSLARESGSVALKNQEELAGSTNWGGGVNSKGLIGLLCRDFGVHIRQVCSSC